MRQSNPNSDKSPHDPEFRFAKILGRTSVYYPREEGDPIPSLRDLTGSALSAIGMCLPWIRERSLSYRKFLVSSLAQDNLKWWANLVATATKRPQDLKGFQEDYLYGRFSGKTAVWDRSAWSVAIGALSSRRIITLEEILVLYPVDGGPETFTSDRDPVRAFPKFMLLVSIIKANGLCHWCNVAFADDNQAVADHYIPWAMGLSRGGHTSQENCVASCVRCNEEKSDMHPADYQRIVSARKRLYGTRGRKL